MKDFKIGDKVKIVENRAESSNPRGFVGYVTALREVPTIANFNVHHPNAYKKGHGYYYWITSDATPRKSVVSGKWSYWTDLELIESKINIHTKTI